MSTTALLVYSEDISGNVLLDSIFKTGNSRCVVVLTGRVGEISQTSILVRFVRVRGRLQSGGLGPDKPSRLWAYSARDLVKYTFLFGVADLFSQPGSW